MISAELAIALAMKMDPIYGKAGSDDSRIKAMYVKRKSSPLFTNSKGMFIRRKQKLFA